MLKTCNTCWSNYIRSLRLKKNMEKTKVIATGDLTPNPISLNGQLKQVQEYTKLGQASRGRDSMMPEDNLGMGSLRKAELGN
ncbi:unnamed protein product, partial [Iphiclides podalirius]